MSAAASAAIAVEGLSKRFDAETLAVDGLSFAVGRGEIWGLLGPNGAGKTTTLRILLGLVRPTAGSAWMLGEPVRPSHAALRRTGTLVDRPAFVPHLSGYDNLRLYWTSGGDAWPAPNLEPALEVAGLGPAIRRRVRKYSQGMRQRLGIAQALLGRPELLILDEPTSGLDPKEMREVRRLLRDVASAGATVLLSSHILAEVEQVCSHAVVMDRGRLVAAGPVAELIGGRGIVYLEVDDPVRAREVLAAIRGVRRIEDEPPGITVTVDGVPRPVLVSTLVRANVGVETVTVRRRLEDAFLELLQDEES